MRRSEFEIWLANIYVTKNGRRMGSRSRSSRVSNCIRVETYEGDLDDHFAVDQLESLLAKLKFGNAAAQPGNRPRHTIPINGNPVTGTATLRAAVRLYQSFCRDWPVGTEQPAATTSSSQVARSARRTSQDHKWPTWPTPDDRQLLELAHLTAQFVRFLHPEIIARLMDDNERSCNDWRRNLSSLESFV